MNNDATFDALGEVRSIFSCHRKSNRLRFFLVFNVNLIYLIIYMNN